MATVQSNQVTVDVVAPLTVILSASPTSITGSGTVKFTATLSGGTASLSGQTVTFYRNGTQVTTQTTNSSGVATYSYSYSNVSTGIDAWTASAEGVTSNTVYIDLIARVTYTVSLEINGSTTTTDVTEGSTVTAIVTVTPNQTAQVSNIPVVLIDKTTGTTQSGTTDTNGTATFSITFSSTGVYNFVATAMVP